MPIKCHRYFSIFPFFPDFRKYSTKILSARLVDKALGDLMLGNSELKSKLTHTDVKRTIKRSDNVTETQETVFSVTVEQLEDVTRKVVREELRAFATQDLFKLDCKTLERTAMCIAKVVKLSSKVPEGR